MNKARPGNKRHHPTPGAAPEDHLSALGNLVDRAFPNPTELFDHGLALLVQQLGVERAVMSRLTELGWEAFWWSHTEGMEADDVVQAAIHHFCPQVLERPERTLVVRDAQVEEGWKHHPKLGKQDFRAYLGCALYQGGRIMGVLSVATRQPKPWNRAEIAMVKAMANLFSKTVEVEQLKHELHLTRDALDLTTAVVEDSALESPASHLPNLHYLDIWLKANLYLARRRGEAMTVAQWKLPLNRDQRANLLEIAGALRGEDLLVDQGREHFLLLLPRTLQEGAQILLDRIRLRLGPIPMGATIWNPLHKADRDDIGLIQAQRRATLALERSQEKAQGRKAEVHWDLLILRAEDFADITTPW